MLNSLPQVFDFPKTTHLHIRTLMQNDEIWFVAADVCKALEIGDVSNAINGNPTRNEEGLDEDEKGTYSVSTPGGNQHMLCINESGLYRLIFKSRKEEAKQFRRWVTHEVLPAIRKTGSYSMPKAAIANNDSISHDDIDTLILRYVERLHNPTARDLGRYLTRYNVAEIRFHLHDLSEQGKLEETFTGHSNRYTAR